MKPYLLLFILLLPIIILAQDEDSRILIPGETQRLSITSDMRASSTFTVVDAPLYVHLQAQSDSEDFDPVLWVVDSGNYLLAYNDNTDEQGNAEIDDLYMLPGSYTIFVDSFNGVSEGEISLSLDIVDPFNTDISESGTFIRANLPEDTIFRYSFPANIDDVLTITVRDISGTLDPYLAIYDESGNLLLANDDHQSADLILNIFDSKISEWEVPVDGTYIIEIHDFSGNSGQFELIITDKS